MKIDILHITDAEMDIAKVLWREKRPVTALEINVALPWRGWKSSTVHTIAMHLEEKGMIKHFKYKGKNYYLPYISEDEYCFVVAKAVVNEVFKGSITKMTQILLCDQDLAEEEYLNLKKLVNSERSHIRKESEQNMIYSVLEIKAVNSDEIQPAYNDIITNYADSTSNYVIATPNLEIGTQSVDISESTKNPAADVCKYSDQTDNKSSSALTDCMDTDSRGEEADYSFKKSESFCSFFYLHLMSRKNIDILVKRNIIKNSDNLQYYDSA